MKTLFNKTTLSVAAVIGFVVCIVALIGGISLQRHNAVQNRTYTGETVATVIKYEIRQEEQTFSDGDGLERTEIVDMYYPVFSYTVDGMTFETVSDTGSNKKTYAENASVNIRYLPSDPSQFYVAGDSFRKVAPYLLYAVSLIAAMVAGKTLIDMIRSR